MKLNDDMAIQVHDGGTVRWVRLGDLKEWLKAELKPKRKPAAKKVIDEGS